MMHKLTSLRGAHLVLWSSPLLLLILVFTLSSQNQSHPHPSVVETTSTSIVPPTTAPTTTLVKHVPVTTVKQYSEPTTTIAPVHTVPTGALNGVITSGENSLNVPVQGPGSWVFSASLPTSVVLVCAETSTPILSKVTITTNQECQLEMSSQGSSVWQLLPTQ
jgi:hypothetical protein